MKLELFFTSFTVKKHMDIDGKAVEMKKAEAKVNYKGGQFTNLLSCRLFMGLLKSKNVL